MKKVTLLAVAFLLPISFMFAQGFAFGLKGGVNFANQKIASVPQSLDNQTGYHGGVYATIGLGPLGIQAEALVSSQRAEWTDPASGGFDIKTKLSSLTVPVLLRFDFAFLNLHVGPQFHYILNAEQETTQNSSGDFNVTDLKDNLKNGEFSVAAGVGANLPLNLNVTARYIIGVSDISDDPDIGEWKNSMFQLSLGYRLVGNK